MGQRLLSGAMTDPDGLNVEPDDPALIAAWKAGDQRAAARLVERHAPSLARFAVSCGAREEIEELVQDTFVRAFSSIDGFRGESSFRTWLFTIERRLLLDRVRSERRRRMNTEIREDSAATEFDALDDLVAGETAIQLRGALEKLTPTQREVFVL